MGTSHNRRHNTVTLSSGLVGVLIRKRSRVCLFPMQAPDFSFASSEEIPFDLDEEFANFFSGPCSPYGLVRQRSISTPTKRRAARSSQATPYSSTTRPRQQPVAPLKSYAPEQKNQLVCARELDFANREVLDVRTPSHATGRHPKMPSTPCKRPITVTRVNTANRSVICARSLGFQGNVEVIAGAASERAHLGPMLVRSSRAESSAQSSPCSIQREPWFRERSNTPSP
eukprot:g82055.t1